MPFAVTFIFLGYVLVYASVANHGAFTTSPWLGLFADAYDSVPPPTAAPASPPGPGSPPFSTRPGSLNTPPVPGSLNIPSGRLSPNQIAAIARAEGAPADVATWLGATSVPESGGDPNAHNPSGATGLLQILPRAWPQLAAAGNLRDPAYNVRAAMYVLSVQGSSAWSGSGTWRGPPVPAGRYHFPFPRASTTPMRNRHVVGRAA